MEFYNNEIEHQHHNHHHRQWNHDIHYNHQARCPYCNHTPHNCTCGTTRQWHHDINHHHHHQPRCQRCNNMFHDCNCGTRQCTNGDQYCGSRQTPQGCGQMLQPISATYTGVYEDRTTELVVVSVLVTGLMVYLIMNH